MTGESGMREKDRLLRQEGREAQEAVLFENGESRGASGAFGGSWSPARRKPRRRSERLREKSREAAEASPLSSFPEASRCVRRQNTMKI